jgi:glycosyltransferase involved in cell wall biosynthesis
MDRSESELRLFYHGSIVPSRLPLTVIDALALLPPSVSLFFAGYRTQGHPDHVDAIMKRTTELGLNGRVTFLGAIPDRPRLLEECANADVGLALMPEVTTDLNEQRMAGASNKVFDYLACGLPVLVTDLPEWSSLYVARGYGRACSPSSAESIAAALRWFFDNRSEAAAMGARGRRRIESEWNYENVFAPVFAMLHECPQKVK